MRTIENPSARNFKGIWIPAEIWLNNDLSAIEVMLLAEIDSLDKLDGCYASNEYFAKFLDTSEASVKRYLTHLKRLGLIYVKKFDGRTRYLGVCLNGKPEQGCAGRQLKNELPDSAKMSGQGAQKCAGRGRKNEPQIIINNKINNKQPPTPLKGDEGEEEAPKSERQRIRESARRVLAAYPNPSGGLSMDVQEIWGRDCLYKHEAEILNAIELWKASEQWQKEGGRYIPSFTSFIEREIWRFKPPERKSNSSTTPEDESGYNALFPPRKEGETEVEYLRRCGFDVTSAEEAEELHNKNLGIS